MTLHLHEVSLDIQLFLLCDQLNEPNINIENVRYACGEFQISSSSVIYF
jgi:hypothetical protein